MQQPTKESICHRLKNGFIGLNNVNNKERVTNMRTISMPPIDTTDWHLKKWSLLDKNGQPVKVGDYVLTDAGLQKIVFVQPPHKPSASGRIQLSDPYSPLYYASNYGLKFVEVLT